MVKYNLTGEIYLKNTRLYLTEFFILHGQGDSFSEYYYVSEYDILNDVIRLHSFM